MDVGDILGSLGGVVIGWGLTQASSWLGTRQADRRLGREVLFFLLELHRLLALLDRSQQQTPALIALIRQHMPALRPEAEPEAEQEVNELLATLLREATTPLVNRQLAALKTGYEAGLLKLASLDPVGAYRLRGLDELLQKMPEAVEAMQAASVAHLGEPLTLPTGANAFFAQHLHAPNVAQALTLVREVMQGLAQRLGRRTRQDLAAVLAREQAKAETLPDRFAAYSRQVMAAFPPASQQQKTA